MIGQHASSYVSAYESLPRDLDPMVSAAGRSGGDREPLAINDETDLTRTHRLSVAQAGAADAAVRSAFTKSSGNSIFSRRDSVEPECQVSL